MLIFGNKSQAAIYQMGLNAYYVCARLCIDQKIKSHFRVMPWTWYADDASGIKRIHCVTASVFNKIASRLHKQHYNG